MTRINPSNRLVQVTRISRNGDSLVLVLSRQLRDLTGWNLGDSIAARLAGEKLILERIPTEQFAKLRTGEAVAEAGR